MSRKGLIYGVAGVVLIAGGLFVGLNLKPSPPPGEPGKAVTRRLTAEQYANIVAEVFGPSIELSGRFEPDPRADSLIEVGTGRVSVSSDGMAQYDSMARGIASQVVSAKYRDAMIPCTPASEKEADEACAGQFLGKVGNLLFRRPLTADEQRRYVEAAGVAAKTLNDFYSGVSLSLAAMLSSPQFLFRTEKLEADPEEPGQYRLDGYSKASRLSFFLWNSIPDDTLLAAAESGELHTERGLTRQVSRMVASPRVEQGVRAFFADMFGFDAMASLAKDTTLYPSFDTIVVQDAQEQTLRTVTDHLVRRRGDYRDIFTTRKTWMTQALASMYNLPLINDMPNGASDSWLPFEFAADDPRAGILTHISFTALHSHPGRSSATLRGKALREVMLCQKVPAPPDDVNFAVLEDTANPNAKTARDRLVVHATVPSCAGCHKLIDPMGLALENFDGDGTFRRAENGVAIDGSGELDGVTFADAEGLGKAVRDNPATPACVADRMMSYALGRTPVAGESAWRNELKEAFADEGYVVPELMGRIVTSPEFFRAAPPAPAAVSASVQNQTEIQR